MTYEHTLTRKFDFIQMYIRRSKCNSIQILLFTAIGLSKIWAKSFQRAMNGLNNSSAPQLKASEDEHPFQTRTESLPFSGIIWIKKKTCQKWLIRKSSMLAEVFAHWASEHCLNIPK